MVAWVMAPKPWTLPVSILIFSFYEVYVCTEMVILNTKDYR